jgi:hypothetical protein
LRERGQHEEAEQLRLGSVAEMVATLRTPSDSDASIGARLDEIFAAETERVANAAVLAELLAPLISEQLGAGVLPKVVAAPTPINPTPAKPSPPPRAAAVSIADFIDEMIAQEKPPERPRETARRAS